jgi:hypothetical protein
VFSYFELTTGHLTALEQCPVIEAGSTVKAKIVRADTPKEFLTLAGTITGMVCNFRPGDHLLKSSATTGMFLPKFEHLDLLSLQYLKRFNRGHSVISVLLGFCALIHLHPLCDGNGRCFRTLSGAALASAIPGFDGDAWRTLWLTNPVFTRATYEGFDAFRRSDAATFQRSFDAMLALCMVR